MCNVCNTAIIGNAFHIRRHSLSHHHIKNITSTVNTKTMKEVLSEPNKTFTDLVKEARVKLTLYICEKNLPFQIVDSLSDICKYIFSDSKIAEKFKLKRKKATTLAVTKITPYVKNQLISKLQSTKFSLIVDETTDVSTTKSIVLSVARFWDENSVQDRFLDLIEVKDCKAESLYQIIKHYFDKNNIPYTNLVGFAADNCSVMMGDMGGLQAKLKQIAPDLVVQGCVCHSVHLCASKACTKLPNTIEQFTRDIYSYFKNSSYRQEDLRECQIFKNEKPHKMLRLSQTRWLSLREKAVKDNLPTTKNILSGLSNNAFKIYFLFLSYVLEIITKINLEFQSESPQLPYLLERVTHLYKIILRSFIKKHILITKNLTDLSVENPDNYLPLDEMYFGAKVDAFLKRPEIIIEKRDLHDFKLRALSFYIELCKQIKMRFNFNNPHLMFATNFTVQNALSGNIMSIAEFVILYPSLDIDVELVNIEWQNLYHKFPYNVYQSYNLMQFWNMVDKSINLSDRKPMFENLMALVKYVLILPHSSAAAERIFSQLNLVKNKLRNKLNILTIASALTIKDALKYNEIDYKTFSI
ncbi:hypothetical protein ALC57_13270 [Trachymyrmex cornetzi]|uniref:HAT C-terminal dimerisation domain-containing protein n=1 Tax=Trachymyrmex cornetzi TaxID=471704 RepID=A0A151IZK2_9HYME|nr:hypothetical protein ALC57_13270 [Trachymyrmex cornetzi]